MKKWLVIFLIAIIVSSIVAISFFLYANKKQEILSKVPANAKSIILIDLQDLITKLVIDDFGSDTKSAVKLSKLIPDSLSAIDLSKSGISLFEKIVMFASENPDNDSVRLNLILRIANIKEFESFIDSLVANNSLDVQKNGDKKIAWSNRYNTIISWNKNFVIVSYRSNNQFTDEKTLRNILSLKKEYSIMADSSFMKKQTADFDILVYSLPYSYYPEKNRQFFHTNIKSMFSLIEFKDGELKIETELSAINGSLLEKLFSTPEKELEKLNLSDTCALNIIFNLNPQAFLQIIKQFSSVKFNNEKVPYVAAWDGRANIVVNGIKTIKSEYISYDFDDDFNKIEVKKSVKDKIWDIRAILGVNKPILDSVFEQTKVYTSKKDTVLFKGSNFVLKKTANSYLCYNKLINRPKIWGKYKTDNISIELDFDKFTPLLKEFGIKSGSLWFNKLAIDKFELSVNKKEHINISYSIYFTDKEKNSLFSIVESWE